MAFQFHSKGEYLSYYEAKVSTKANSKVFRKINTVPKATKSYNNNGTFVSPIYAFSLAGNINTYTVIQSTNKDKDFYPYYLQRKMPTLAGNKHISIHFVFYEPHLSHLSTAKTRGAIRQQWTSKWLFQGRHTK